MQHNTDQRRAILKVLTHSAGPLSIQEIYTLAAQYLPKIGKATVYRTIKALKEEGKVMRVVLPGNLTRYERTGLSAHHHFVCRVCLQAKDLFDVDLNISSQSLRLPLATLIENYELVVTGICEQCNLQGKNIPQISRPATTWQQPSE